MFDTTVDCDPDSDSAALEVAVAFFASYNAQDLDRLRRMSDPELHEIWDPSAIAHTRNALNSDLEAWAAAGWQVDDRFELRRVVATGRTQDRTSS